MIARATVALGLATVPKNERHKRLAGDYEIAVVEGEGADWEAAKAACTIPDGALILTWRRIDA